MKLSRLDLIVTRPQMILLALALCMVAPLLLLFMLGHAIFGDTKRAAFMAVAIDEMGNALCRGDPRVTLSARVGNGLVAGYSWAPRCAKIIDALFGQNHCISQADKFQEWD